MSNFDKLNYELSESQNDVLREMGRRHEAATVGSGIVVGELARALCRDVESVAFDLAVLVAKGLVDER